MLKNKHPNKTFSVKPKNKQTANNKPEKIKNTGNIKIVFFLFVIVFILYGNTIPNHYSLDDEFVTYNNPVIQKGINAIPEIFSTHYVNNAQQSYDYRPVVKLSFALEYALFKDNPHVSHFINVLLYFLLCVLLYFILKKLLHKYNPWMALIITILYAAHPVHTEVVASLKNRDELLSMIGALAAWYCVIKYSYSKKWVLLLLALLFLFLAYYSKSNVIVYIAVIPLSLYFFTDTKPSKLLILTAILLAVIVLFNILPRIFLRGSQREILYFENPLYFEKGLWIRIGTALIVVLFYLRLLVFPHPLVYYYGFNQIPVTTPDNIWAIVSVVVCITMLGFAIFLFKRRHILSFGILFFFITISIFSNIIKPPPGIVAERFLLSASLGFIIMLLVLIMMVFRVDIYQKTPYIIKNIKKPLLIFLLILIPYVILTISRNPDWKDYKTLYSHDIRYQERSAKANTIYASFLYSETKLTKDQKKQMTLAKEAAKYYEQALKIYPDYVIALNNLGNIYFRYFQKPRKAMRCWKSAATHDTAYAEPLLNIATAFDEMNINDSAEIYYLASVKVKKDFTAAYSKLSDLYFRQGHLQKAITTNQKIMETDISSDVPYINIGNYYLLSADTINAIDMWEKAIAKQAANPKLCTTLSRYFEHKGNFQKAAYYNKLSLKKKN